MKMVIVLSLFISIAFVGPALACHFDSFNPNANCDGWAVGGSVYFTREYADLTWNIDLSDGSTTVASFSGSERIYAADPTFSYGAPWGMELCGDYTVTGTFHITNDGGNDTKTINISFRCICDEPDGCTGTPGYWKNHPEEWPVSALVVGGIPYSKAQLMAIFDVPTKGDATIKLFHHLVAAKLNVLHGAPSSIQGVIDAADAFLVVHPLYSKPTGAARNECNGYKNALVAYNESDPCGGTPVPLVSKPLLTMPATDQVKTWGAVKEMYRK
jgi:hypothetical protein